MNDAGIAGLISSDAIPGMFPLSDEQRAMIGLLSSAVDDVDDVADDAGAFVERAVRALALYGDCTGLACTVNDSADMVLCTFLRSEIALSTSLQPELAHRKQLALEAVDRLQATLGCLCETSRWSLLSDRPHPTHQRLVHFHLAILPSPAYSLVAAPLHRGICAKVAQLGCRDGDLFDERLGGFVRPAIRIALELPAGRIRDSPLDYAPGEFDGIVQETIDNLTKQHVGRDGRTQYARATLETFWRDWAAMFYATAKLKPFRAQERSEPLCSKEQVQELARPEELAETHPSRQAYLVQIQELDEVELAELEPERARAPRSAKSRRIAHRGMQGLDAAHAALAFNPSPSMPGALPHVVLTLIYAGLDELRCVWPELNYRAAKALVKAMLHLGRRHDWLLNLRIGDRPALLSECARPIYDPDRGRICYTPLLYLGLPASLRPGADQSGDVIAPSRAWQQHDVIYEPISLIHEIILPGDLARALRNLTQARRAAIERWPLEASGLGCGANCGPAWLWLSGGRLTLLDETAIGDIFIWLTDFVRRYIPGYPLLRATHLIRSFEGYYTHFGLRGVYRYYCSERARSYFEMPLRYSRVSAQQVYEAHEPACAKFEWEIAWEQSQLGLASGVATPETGEPRGRPATGNDTHFGSWHCTRLDVSRQIVAELRCGLREPQTWDPHLEARRALHNARVRLLAVSLALLGGLRPFEILRIQRRHVDVDGLWLAVRGKPHCTRLAFRRLPILPELASALGEVMEQGAGRGSPTRNLIGFYDASGRWEPAGRVIWRAPWRRRAGAPGWRLHQTSMVFVTAFAAICWPLACPSIC